MSRILTGIQSTGIPHLGNILGAIKPAIEMSNNPKNDSFLFIADMHSLITIHDSKILKENTYTVAAAWLAFGLDVDKTVLYRQSDVPEVSELTWYLNCFTPYPMLANAHSFKDKANRLAEVNAGLFIYPVLMAADIILYDADFVPVGKDQLQHLEITRDIVSSFNNQYGETFVMPEAITTEQVMLIPGVDGQKMSKSYNNTINIFLPDKELRKVIMKIITDATPIEQPKNPDTCTVFNLFSIVAEKDKVEEMRQNYLRGGYGYGQAKEALYQTIAEKFRKERELYTYYISNKDELDKKLKQGEDKARLVAAKTLKRVREKLGYSTSNIEIDKAKEKSDYSAPKELNRTVHFIDMPKDYINDLRFALEKARQDRPRYFEWIKNEISTAINLINKFDKIYVLGAFGARLLKAVPNFYNQFMATYNGPDKDKIKEDELIQEDDDIEVLLEYIMSIATATTNNNIGVIPLNTDIEEIYNKLQSIKSNFILYDLSEGIPLEGNESDHWLRFAKKSETSNIRGDGYDIHIIEIYNELFQPFNGFLERYYGFNSKDILTAILKLDKLVYSKIGNPLGSAQSHKRFVEWSEKKADAEIIKITQETGKSFMRQFTEDNPDLYNELNPEGVTSYKLDDITSCNRIFWVIPNSEKERKIFEILSLKFGDNGDFFNPPNFKGFPLNSSLIKLKPLIREGEKYYHFSSSLAFRNIFGITENLLKSADTVYYDSSYRGNTNSLSKDNYIELKTLTLFQKLLPSTKFYHSLDYDIIEQGLSKKTELDILGISNDTIYLIEVKAGELNVKHQRGALKGLKQRLRETINEGSYQCHRALTYIKETEIPVFSYVENKQRKTLNLNKSGITSFFKISVTFEHFATLSANLKYLIGSGVLSSDYKWTWIVSLFDLMVFAELIESEKDFKEYLTKRLSIYERNDVEIFDEIDVLGYYLKDNISLPPAKKDHLINLMFLKKDIDDYYTKKGLGMSGSSKPKKIINND